MLPILEKANLHKSRTAIHSDGRVYSYQDLINHSAMIAHQLLNGAKDLNESRIALMVNPGFEYVASLWAIWQAGGIAVPLCITHPLPSLEYVLEDTGATTIIVSSTYTSVLHPYTERTNCKLIIPEVVQDENNEALPAIDITRKALILYTSGTTNKPKGVVTTHENIIAQITTLVQSWEWSEKDHTICVLPLHHVHGIINVICCSLWVGAVCDFMPEFSAPALVHHLSAGAINVFMAVPTIYFKLIAFIESCSKEQQEKSKWRCSNLD